MFCEGIFLGSEALWAGEPLRLLPREGGTAIVDVLVPECFIVRVQGLQPPQNGTINADRAESIHLLAVGKVYTIEPTSSDGNLAEPAILPKSMDGYRPWYHKSGPGDKYESGFHNIMGRLYEYEAMQKWFGENISPIEALDKGAVSVRKSREYATSHRTDHTGGNHGWFWGEDRAHALGLATFNNIEVGEYNREREPKRAREILAVLDGRKDRLAEPIVSTLLARYIFDLGNNADGYTRRRLSATLMKAYPKTSPLLMFARVALRHRQRFRALKRTRSRQTKTLLESLTSTRMMAL